MSFMRSIFSPFQLLLLLCPFIAFSQKGRPNVKFGNVTVADFTSQYYPVDSAASAVYLFDVGSSYYLGNTTGSFDVIHEKHAKIRLLKKTSFEDIATIKVNLLKLDNYEQKIDNLQATTYNVENGQVVATKLDKSSIFKDKSGNFITVKFTFPNIKEGSIIEYSYKLTLPGYRFLPPWEFQDQYPRLWTEYKVEIPEFYDFVFFPQGYVPFTVDSVKESHDNFNIVDRGEGAFEGSSTYSFRANTNMHLWAIENVPALKEENYTTTVDDYTSKIQFELSSIRYPERPAKIILRDWYQVSFDLMKDEDFGEALSHDNGWVKDDVKKAVAGLTDSLAKAKAIYNYVRDNYSCTDNTAIYLSQPLKKTYQLKKGNVVDINMLLAVMLQNAGFEVHPVYLSTRRNGKAVDTYPLINRFNYEITQVLINGVSYVLDAANGSVAFGMLPNKCYNGNARIISPDFPALINLSADSLKESKITSVFLINADNGISGSYSSTLGKLESINTREDLSTVSKRDDYFKAVKKNYLFDVDISNTEVDSLKTQEYPVAIKYDFKFNTNEDIIYFNPLLADQLKENPFKSADRMYPVEMPYCQDNVYILNMEIPKGYKVEELPKSARVMLNETDGMFEYIIAASPERIQLRCRTLIKKANFTPDDYQTLRDFYTYVVKKEAEQIVLKKN